MGNLCWGGDTREGNAAMGDPRQVRNIPGGLWPVEESRLWRKQGELEEHTKKNLIVEINLCVYDPSLLHNILLHQKAGTE